MTVGRALQPRPTGVSTSGDQLSTAQLERICHLIRSRTGIQVSADRREFVQGRIAKILRRRGIGSFREYVHLLERDATGDELTQLTDAISTNYTAFFREPEHFDLLRARLLPPLFARFGCAPRIWCAAAATGAEPYSLAMETLEAAEAHGYHGEVTLLATDISTRALETARAGVYPEKMLAGVSQDRRRRWFQRGVGANAGTVRVKAQLRQAVQYAQFNLLESTPDGGTWDLIFLRNVMIYFDRQTQADVVRRLGGALRPGGHLVIGHSENLTGIPHGLQALEQTLFRRPT
ncbi:MAG: protein-glutamate O-methyltransferase CheR [Polyangiales bacterium]